MLNSLLTFSVWFHKEGHNLIRAGRIKVKCTLSCGKSVAASWLETEWPSLWGLQPALSMPQCVSVHWTMGLRLCAVVGDRGGGSTAVSLFGLWSRYQKGQHIWHGWHTSFWCQSNHSFLCTQAYTHQVVLDQLYLIASSTQLGLEVHHWCWLSVLPAPFNFGLWESECHNTF